ncbi:hypothetical protein JCM11641_008470 [Rhodosporidiobolus odoratus]
MYDKLPAEVLTRIFHYLCPTASLRARLPAIEGDLPDSPPPPRPARLRGLLSIPPLLPAVDDCAHEDPAPDYTAPLMLLPRPASPPYFIRRASSVSSLDPTYSCPSSSSSSASSTWQNKNAPASSPDDDLSTSTISPLSTTTLPLTNSDGEVVPHTSSVNPSAAISVLSGAMGALLSLSADKAGATGKRRRRSALPPPPPSLPTGRQVMRRDSTGLGLAERDAGYRTGMWTQGEGCVAAVSKVEMGQGWFIGATGPTFGTYGCNLTEIGGESKVTWHSAESEKENWEAVLCVWTTLDSSKSYTASVVNSPQSMDGHGWLWLQSNAFRYSDNGVAQGLVTAFGPQIATVAAPASSLLSATSASFSTTSASSVPSSSSSSPTSNADDGPFLTNKTWLYSSFFLIGCLACLAVGSLCFRKPKPPTPEVEQVKRRIRVEEEALGKEVRRWKRRQRRRARARNEGEEEGLLGGGQEEKGMGAW